jgi:tetratricopeptide (TPR) repeat protein
VVEEGRRSQRQADNRDAVGLAFQARAISARGLSPKGNAEARKLYDQALEISPDYLLALIGRAYTDIVEDMFFHGTIPLDKAEQILVRALEIEPDNVSAKYTKAMLYYFKGDMDRTAFFAEQIIAIDPSYAPAYAALNRARVAQGRATEAIALEEKAIRLSPRDPFVDLWYQNLGATYLFLGRDEEAVPWMEKAIAMNDKVYFYHSSLASAYALTGRLDAARKELEAATRLVPGLTIAKAAASFRQSSSNETYLKQADHYLAGLRLAGMPEN